MNRGGSLIQVHQDLKMTEEHPPKINNPLNEALHFYFTFLEDRHHIFSVYIRQDAYWKIFWFENLNSRFDITLYILK